MKNNMRKVFLLNFFFILYFNLSSTMEDFVFESKSIELLNSTKTLIAKDGVKITSDDGVNISALKSVYNKTSKILSLERNIIIEDKPNEFSVTSEKIIYDKSKEIIFSKNKTKILISDLYVLNGEDINIDRKTLKYSLKKSNFKRQL